MRDFGIPPEKYDQLSASEAVAFQKELRQHIDISKRVSPVKTIGGADISFNKYSEIVYAGIIVLNYPDMTEVCRASVTDRALFPYISGLLAFREVPALLKVWEKLPVKPDVLMLDGQGIAHERRLGIATHFGLLTDWPTLGCAKSRLSGLYEAPGDAPFAESPLLARNGEQIGVALRTKLRCNPVFVSPGHRISIQQSVDIVKNCVGKYRIPTPTRLAHHFVNEVRVAGSAAENPQGSLF
ncbi:MAG: endonuclease V [Mucilaginibacter polytrichastri]|nr:endonuclease V [Mucilaginibacter polytrichastri]